MNKKEIIDELEYNQHPLASSQEEIEWNNALDLAIDIIKEELDEPVKLPEPWRLEKHQAVPQFIDTWIQGAKYNGFDLYEAMNNCDVPNETDYWIQCNPETFARAWIYGYEVEKEKLYTVKFANEDFGKTYIGIFKAVNKLGISSLPLNDDGVKSWFTEDELKKLKIWKNPAFEIVEVEE